MFWTCEGNGSVNWRYFRCGMEKPRKIECTERAGVKTTHIFSHSRWLCHLNKLNLGGASLVVSCKNLPAKQETPA